MVPTITIDYTGFKTMTDELSTLSGKSYAAVLKSEAASSVKIAALQSPIASATQIAKAVTDRLGAKFNASGGEISTNVRTNIGRTWFTQNVGSRAVRVEGPSQPGQAHLKRIATRGGYYMVFDAGPTIGHHLPDAIWAEYLSAAGERAAAIKAKVAELKKRRGLERNSWLQMGDAIGVQLSSVAPQGNLREDIARAATANSHAFQNGAASESTAGPSYTLTVTNTSPVAIKRNGQTRLDRAINQRVKAFQFAVDKNFLEDLQYRARRWPGIFVQAA